MYLPCSLASTSVIKIIPLLSITTYKTLPSPIYAHNTMITVGYHSPAPMLCNLYTKKKEKLIACFLPHAQPKTRRLCLPSQALGGASALRCTITASLCSLPLRSYHALVISASSRCTFSGTLASPSAAPRFLASSSARLTRRPRVSICDWRAFCV